MNRNWKDILVPPSFSIRDVMNTIDKTAMKIALVVDDDCKLLGTVTDGDIRRAILKNITLDATVGTIMNTNPTTVNSKTTKVEMLNLMEQKGISSVPILDNGTVTGVSNLHDILQKKRYSNPVFLMAGGFGTRLQPLTDNCPKPMLKVGNKPILETLIRRFIKAGFSNFYISTHYLPEQIEQYFGDGSDFGVSISYVHEDTPLGTGGALGLLPKDLPGNLPLIMINGDVLTTLDFQRVLNFHNENSADATICVREYNYQIPYGVINGDGNQITSMVEKPTQHFFVNAGIYVVSPQVIESVENNQKIDMPTLLEKQIKNRKKVLMFPLHEYWLDIGRMEDFRQAQIDIKSLDID